MKTALYRHYDRIGGLLYVGISNSVAHRTSQHARYSGWSDQIVRIDVEYFENREEALAAEVRAIRVEKPVYNVIGQEKGCTGWAVLDLNEGWADGWYFDYSDIPDMLDFYKASFPEAALVIVRQVPEDPLTRSVQRAFDCKRSFTDHPEYFARLVKPPEPAEIACKYCGLG